MSTLLTKPNIKEEMDFYYSALDDAFNQILHGTPAPPSWQQIHYARTVKTQLRQLLISRESPSNLFSLINTGYFKECYKIPLERWVIKFCSSENNSSDEKRLYDSALDYGICDLFPITYYISLPRTLPATSLDCDGISETLTDGTVINSSYQKLNTLVIQQEIITLEEVRCNNVAEKVNDRDLAWSYSDHPIIAGYYILPEELFNTMDTSYTWLKEVLDYFGNEIFEAFCRFCEENKIKDLHAGNIGYIIDEGARIPVIIDWLSN